MVKKRFTTKESGIVSIFKGIGRVFGWGIKGLRHVVNLPFFAYLFPARRNIELSLRLELRELQDLKLQSVEEKKARLQEIIESNIDRRKTTLIVPEIIYGSIAIVVGIAIIAILVSPLNPFSMLGLALPIGMLVIALPMGLIIGSSLINMLENFRSLLHDDLIVRDSIAQVKEMCAKDERIVDQDLERLIDEIHSEIFLDGKSFVNVSSSNNNDDLAEKSHVVGGEQYSIDGEHVANSGVIDSRSEKDNSDKPSPRLDSQDSKPVESTKRRYNR